MLVTRLLAASGGLLAFYLLAIGYHARIALDDWYFLGTLREHGFAGSIVHWYMTWQGRVSAYAVINATLVGWQAVPSLLPYTILLLALLTAAVQRLIANLGALAGLAPDAVSPAARWLVAFQVAGGFIVANPEFHTFYWLNVSAMYYGGITAATWGVALLLEPAPTRASAAALALAFAYAGSSSEAFGALLFVALAAATLVVRLAAPEPFRAARLPRCGLAVLACGVGVAVMLAAPGNAVRRAQATGMAPLAAFVAAVGTTAQFAGVCKERLSFFLLFLPPLLWLGTRFQTPATAAREDRLAVAVLAAGPLAALVSYGYHVPMTYALSSMGPLRAMTCSFWPLWLGAGLLLAAIGCCSAFPRRLARALAVAALAATTLYGLAKIRRDLPAVAAYAAAERARTARLLELRAGRTPAVVELDPIGRAPWVMKPCDIVGSPTDWRNEGLRYALDLPFRIVERGAPPR